MSLQARRPRPVVCFEDLQGQPRDIAWRTGTLSSFSALRLRAGKKTGKAGSSILPCDDRSRPGSRNMPTRPPATTRDPLSPRPPTEREPRIRTDCRPGRVPHGRYPNFHGEREDARTFGPGYADATPARPAAPRIQISPCQRIDRMAAAQVQVGSARPAVRAAPGAA